MILSRHDLIWPNSEGWDEIFTHRPLEESTFRKLREWRNEDLPVVVARYNKDREAHNSAKVAIGITLLGDGEGAVERRKIRFGAAVSKNQIERFEKPLPLSLASSSSSIAGVRAKRQTNLLELEAAVRAADLEFRVYGSLALQSLTGEPYFRENSDIDLLFYPKSQSELRVGLSLISFHSRHLPLDGEIVFSGGYATAWKEWLMAEGSSCRSQVLVKAIDQLALWPASRLYESLATGLPSLPSEVSTPNLSSTLNPV